MRDSNKVDWTSVIGIFGGSFDPPHQGHRHAIEGLLRNPGLKQVWVMPSGIPPWKSASTSAADRLAMARLAFGSLQDVQVLDWEFELAHRHPSEPTTTARTLEFIRPRLSGAEVAWVIGTDQLVHLDQWAHFPLLLGQCHWIVLQRKPSTPAEQHHEEQAFQKLQDWESSGLLQRDGKGWRVRAAGRSRQESTFIEVCATDAPALSSTKVRERLARTGELGDLENGLAPEVADYLKEKKLYGTRKHDL